MERGVTAMDSYSSPESTADQESIGTLLSGLVGDLQNLIRGEVELAKVEARDDLQTAARSATLLGAAAAVGLTGLIVFMMAVSILLSDWMRTWLAFGIVGLVLLIIAAIVGVAGKNRLSASNMKPERTIESLKEDKEWASQQVNSVKN